MPQAPSPFSSVPPGIARPASPPPMAMQPPGPGMAPPGAGGSPSPSMGSTGGLENIMAMLGGAPGNGPQGAQDMDLFQRLAALLSGGTMEGAMQGNLNKDWLLIFAGMGMREALEKSGKYQSKPHRSNEELGQSGYPTGIAGQTGQPSPDQMTRGLQVPVPGGVGIG